MTAKNQRLYVSFLAIISLSFLFFISPKVHAAAPTGATNVGSYLTTSPISVDVTVTPGQSETTTLSVQNDSSVAETINVKLDKFAANGDFGAASITTPEKTDPSVGWVHFSKTTFVAQPGVWNNITMTIDMPNYASLGYYYAVLFIPKSAQISSDVSDQIKGANAIFVLVDTQSSNEAKQLSLTSFSSVSGLYQFLPATFNILVKNTGNIHLIPQGDVYISRTMNGKVIDTLPINAGLGNILPDSSRQFTATWTDGLPSFEAKTVDGQAITVKNGQPVEQLRWNFSEPISKFRFGRYYAHLVLVYNNGNHDIPIDAYLSFWVIPWKLILIILVVIGAIIVFWKSIKKGVKHLLSRRNKNKKFKA
jgi:hypothetical protein